MTNLGPDINYATMHAVPLATLLIDLSLNALCIEFNKILINFAVDLIYFNLLFAVTRISGRPVYNIYTFDSTKSWLLALALFPFTMILYCLTFGLNYAKCKLLTNKS